MIYNHILNLNNQDDKIWPQICGDYADYELDIICLTNNKQALIISKNNYIVVNSNLQYRQNCGTIRYNIKNKKPKTKHIVSMLIVA